jgi:hypothetical protein
MSDMEPPLFGWRGNSRLPAELAPSHGVRDMAMPSRPSRRSRGSSSELQLESSTISTVDRRARVHVDATDVSERLTRCWGFADRMHELASALAGRGTREQTH